MDNIIFNHLHVHTEYSFRDAISHTKDIVDAAIENGSTAVAVTDHGNMHATMELYKICKKKNLEFKKKGDIRRIKPIIGYEGYVLPSIDLLQDVERKHEKKHIIFLAKDIIGVHQIYEANTRGQMLKDKDTYPRITHKDIEEIFVGGHVICLSACVNGEIASWIREGNMDKAREVALFYKKIFGEDYYLELQDHNLTIEYEYIGGVIELSKELNIPLVATNDCHYVKKDDYKIREMVVAMRWGKSVNEIEPDCQELYMKSTKEMVDLFRQWPEAISNTVVIADKCNVDGLLVEGEVDVEKIDDTYTRFILSEIPYGLTFDEIKIKTKDYFEELHIESKYYTIEDKTYNNISNIVCTLNVNSLCSETKEEMGEKISQIKDNFLKIVHVKHFPKFKVPEGFKNEKEYITHLAYENMKIKYPENVHTKEALDMIRARIDYELGIICDLHYEGYLLIVQDFINYGKGIGLIGPGRGSAVGSIVCYLIGITSVDPLPYNLIFERFLNKDRVSDPDIDTDFAPTIRDLVIEYVKEIYGADAVCQIVTYGTLGARTAIRNAGRVHNIPIMVCDKIAKMIPSVPGIELNDALKGNAKKELEPVPELLEEMKNNSEVAFLVEQALKIEGLIVQTGVHAAGVIIADKAVSNYCPLSYDSKKQIWVTQAAKDSCEHDFGLLKMDFLGLENLKIISGTFRDIEKNYGIKLTLDSISLTNEEEISEVLLNIFVKGQTKGVFQFESDGMTNLLRRFKPKGIEDLILLNAAYRPGPIQYIDEIIDIKNGNREAVYICPEMKDILGVTFSKPIYQEQIQQIFHNVAGFSLGVADIIRRAMAKKKIAELELYLPIFKERLNERGVSENDANIFCDQLMDFAKYAFNKSHAAAYAVVAYQTAWLKYYYPVEYMANLLNSSTTKTMPIYINECKRMEIKVFPPDVNRSGMGFTPTQEGEILFGLKIKNTGVSGLDIINEREENGKFVDILDFSNRMLKRKSRCMHSNVIDSYALSGALDCFGKTRKTMNLGMTEYVKAMNKMNEIEQRQKEIEEEKVILSKTIEDVFAHFSSFCDKESLYDYAKKMKKAHDKWEAAKLENDDYLMETADFEMQQAFPIMFLSMIDLEEKELRDALCEYAIAYASYQRKENGGVKEERVNIAKLNLSQALSIDLGEYDRIEILDKEKELLGFYASGHPLDGMRSYIEENASTWIGALSEEHHNSREKLVGRIANLKMLYRKSDHRPMCKFTLEGLTGDIECICFTKAYADCSECLQDGATVVLYGMIKAEVEYDEYGEVSDITLEMQVENAQKPISKQRIYLRVDNMFQFNQLRNTIDKECGGNNTLYVYFNDTQTLRQYYKTVTSYDVLRKIIPNMYQIELRE